MHKFIVVLLVCLCLAAGTMATEVPERFITFLTRSFEIPKSEAERCVEKAGVTLEILRDFEASLGEEHISEDARKTACIFSCVAESKELLINGKVQGKKVHDLVTRSGSNAPEDLMQKVHSAIDVCIRESDGITNQCDMVHKFLSCIVKVFND